MEGKEGNINTYICFAGMAVSVDPQVSSKEPADHDDDEASGYNNIGKYRHIRERFLR
jgi:hypothetical protein